MTKKALIVSPYLDHLGGGERYMLTLASVVESLGYELFFAWDNLEEIEHLREMLGIKLVSPNLDQAVMTLYHSKNPLGMYLATKKYDLVVYLSDGSLPLLGGKKNLIHMQVPFHNVGGKSLKNKLKKPFCHDIIVNSEFTKRIVDHEFGINSTVLYPPVPLLPLSNKKEEIILSVGRFEPSLNSKKQDILISAFKKFSPAFPSWRLVLAGATTSEEWVSTLREMAVGYNIEFVVNASYDNLQSLYAKSSIYWHAAGYDVEETKSPELTEHFGISTVEAISAGCVPLVVGKGGQPEIVESKDLQWSTQEELVEKTARIIRESSRESYLQDLDVSRFSEGYFRDSLEKIINS